MTSVLSALIDIQRELRSPKDQKASKYVYRNIEDINEAVKPLAARNGCAVVYSDVFENGHCISTCTLIADDGELSAQGVSAVNYEPQYMSIEQSCGAASSYARKYAAQGLFAIDSSDNDPDKTYANKKPEKPIANKEQTAKAALWAALGQDQELALALMGTNHPTTDKYYKAVLEQWKAIELYAAEHNGDSKALAEGCRKRSDYEPTPEWCLQRAKEFSK